MQLQTIKFTANEQSLQRTSGGSLFASSTVSYIRALFDLGENWGSWGAVRAVWKSRTQQIATVLADGACMVPAEVLANPGQVYVNLVASEVSGNVVTDRLTSYPVLALVVDAQALVDGSETAEITPSQFEQFVEAVEGYSSQAIDARDRAEAAQEAAETAQGKAEDAQEAAETAQEKAEAAQGKAEDAQGFAEEAATAAGLSAADADRSEGEAAAWATGSYSGGGIPVPDTAPQHNNNAKYYSEQAEAALEQFTTPTASASTLPAGSSATASYSDGNFAFGIPKGEQGEQGEPGEVTNEDLWDILPTDSASGAIASFSDGAKNVPLKSLVVDIAPVQDLHGYDSPWPAGGGVNKLPPLAAGETTKNGIKVTSNGAGTYVISGLASADAIIDFILTPNVTIESGMYLHLCNTDTASGCSFNLRTPEDVGISGKGTSVQYDKVDLSSHAGEVVGRIRFYVANGTNLNISIKPMIVSDSANQTVFYPYSNICPISGWTGATVIKAGGNLFDKTATDSNKGYVAGRYLYSSGVEVDTSTWTITEYIPIKGGATYTLTPVSGSNPSVCFYDSNKTYLSGNNYGGATVKSVTAPDNAFYMRASFKGENVDLFQIVVGSSVSSYAPYNAATYPITWQTEAGTVYGGTVDVTNGKLTSCPYYASYNGEALVGPWVSSMDAYTPGGTPTTGAQVVDLGGIVTEYTLTPAELTTLLGQNNIFADCGSVDVEYRADTKLYINKIVAALA